MLKNTFLFGLLFCVVSVNAQSFRDVKISYKLPDAEPQVVRGFDPRTGSRIDVKVEGKIDGLDRSRIRAHLLVYAWPQLADVVSSPLHYEGKVNATLLSSKKGSSTFHLDLKNFGAKKVRCPEAPVVIVGYLTTDEHKVINTSTGEEEDLRSSESSPICIVSKHISKNWFSAHSVSLDKAISVAKYYKAICDGKKRMNEMSKEFSESRRPSKTFPHPDKLYVTSECDHCGHTGKCPSCHNKPIKSCSVTCFTCNGTGKDYYGVYSCSACGGTGMFHKTNKCKECSGTGKCSYCKWNLIIEELEKNSEIRRTVVEGLLGGYFDDGELDFINVLLEN